MCSRSSLARPGAAVGLALVAGCGGVSQQLSPAAAESPQLALATSRCQLSSPPRNPLVTEWPASEKSHLQSLASERAVAVAYTGCDLRVIPECVLEGGYRWVRTTVATDTLEIGDADQLYAKLPIGAAGLEGELARSGRIAVQTTVAGQLRLVVPPGDRSRDPACEQATHAVEAVSVGAFKLFSGQVAHGGGAVGIAGIGAGGRHTSQRVTLREAGVPGTCSAATDAAPAVQCASPIQVFLRPLHTSPSAHPSELRQASSTLSPRPPSETGVHVSFPAPEDDEEVWTLRDRTSKLVCTLPCGAWITPASGFYLQREQPRAELRLPPALPHAPGTRVRADYQLGRGMPSFSKWLFYFGGVPSGILGGAFATWGVVQAATGCETDRTIGDRGCFPDTGFLVGVGVFYLAAGGASYWWYAWSREEKFETHEQLEETAQAGTVGFSPTGLEVRF